VVGGDDVYYPNKYVSLTEAVVEAFANQHLDAILAAGLQSHEAKTNRDPLVGAR
jgi:hypothetical protein